MYENKCCSQNEVPYKFEIDNIEKLLSDKEWYYRSSARTDAQWASFSNWCPGDVIPVCVYDLGNLNQGSHTFKFEVPDAKFEDKQGEIPLSVYIQGDK